MQSDQEEIEIQAQVNQPEKKMQIVALYPGRID